MGKRADKRSFTQQRGSGASRAGNRNRSSKASPARMAALEAVRIMRERDAFAQEAMINTVDKARLEPEDRAFATRLVLGVAATRGVLDDALNRCMHSPKDVKDDVRDALRISAYEMLFLGKSDHAAVDQGVELVRQVAPRATGVANVVLRKLVQMRHAFPFGDATKDLSAFARQQGFPIWLAERLAKDLGEPQARAFMAVSNEPAPVFVGVNSVRATDSEVVELLEAVHGEPVAAGIEGVPVAGCYRLSSGRVLTDGRARAAIADGKFLVSDVASQAVAALVLSGDKPKSFLEIGAGRATKTILIQSNAVRRWGSQIEDYTALDSHDFKSGILKERTRAYGTQVSEAVTGNALELDNAVGEKLFDTVFIDAPCSGLGTLRRHVDIRWRITEHTIAEHADLGRRMMSAAASHVRPGGLLAFATCTITREENAGAVVGFLKSETGSQFELVPIGGASAFSTVLRSGGSDAHFLALMRRKAD